MAYGSNNYNSPRSNYQNNYNNRNRGGSNQVDVLKYQKLTVDNYVDVAEKVIDHLLEIDGKSNIITSSKIRGILALNSEIYNMVTHSTSDTLSDEIKAKIQYLKVRRVHDMGREKSVKSFSENAHLIDCIKDIGETKAGYILFARYLEALVAFRKYKGPKDQ